MTSAWEQGRPIYKRLPSVEEKYQVETQYISSVQQEENLDPVANWLTLPLDENLMLVKGKVANFYVDYLDPATAKIENLDWLAQMCGFTGDYWETSWSETQKRSLIANSYSFIWSASGTRSVLEFLLATFALQGKIYLLGEFLADGNKAGDTLGGEALEYFLLLPLAYLRTSTAWRLVTKFNRLYSPIYVKTTVCYSQFFAGFSITGDPVFDSSVGF